jgi:RNAse (barnase) inhibitor barstar
VHFISKEEADPIMLELSARELRVFRINGGSIRTCEDLFLRLAQEMSFPNYFGMNWDALDECLRDMTWLPAKGYVLFCIGAEDLWRRDPRIAGDMVESWLFAAEEWRKTGKPFHLVFIW